MVHGRREGRRSDFRIGPSRLDGAAEYDGAAGISARHVLPGRSGITGAPRRRCSRNSAPISEENARIAQEEIFGIENSLKAIKGYQSGLLR